MGSEWLEGWHRHHFGNEKPTARQGVAWHTISCRSEKSADYPAVLHEYWTWQSWPKDLGSGLFSSRTWWNWSFNAKCTTGLLISLLLFSKIFCKFLFCLTTTLGKPISSALQAAFSNSSDWPDVLYFQRLFDRDGAELSFPSWWFLPDTATVALCQITTLHRPRVCRSAVPLLCPQSGCSSS